MKAILAAFLLLSVNAHGEDYPRDPAVRQTLAIAGSVVIVGGMAATFADLDTGYNVVDHLQGHQHAPSMPRLAPHASTHSCDGAGPCGGSLASAMDQPESVIEARATMLHFEAGAALGLAFSTANLFDDRAAHRDSPTLRAHHVRQALLATLILVSAKKVYDWRTEPWEPAYVQAYKIGFSELGAAWGSSMVELNLRDVLIHPEVTLPMDPGGIPTVAIGGSF